MTTAAVLPDPAAFPEPRLVHSSPWCELWQGRAETVLPRYETESLGLTVTDPPYGVTWESNYRAEKFGQLRGDSAGESDRDTVHEVLRHCVRLVGQMRHLYVFGPTDVLAGLKVASPVELVWNKTTMSSGNMAASWGKAHEPITFCVSVHRHGGKAHGTGGPTRGAVPARLRKGTVLTFARPTGRKVRHPSEKPVPLLRELIESSSRQGETILDPFAGVGSTGVAAILSGRKTILVEDDPRWVEIAHARILVAEQVAQLAATA